MIILVYFVLMKGEIMYKYINSNLIMESSWIEKMKTAQISGGECYSEENYGNVKVCRLDITDDEHEHKKGKYVTVYTPELWQLESREIERIVNILSDEIRSIMSYMLGKASRRVLVTGIGNRRISSDSLGPLTTEKINVTRHVEIIDNSIFKASGLCSVCGVSCGVMGDTGIETVELLRGIVREVQPDIVIAVDALAAKAAERLGATVQISDTGISPGAGIGNRQCAINGDTIGAPVMAIGVPTVVSAATLVGDILSKYTKIKLDGELDRLLSQRKNFFVAPKECDLVSKGASTVLARAIDKALGVI